MLRNGFDGIKKPYLRIIHRYGWYDTVCPAPIYRNVFENPVWYTSYTPYQAEISQGRLEALMNFQTMVSDLTALPLSNCSLLDEATAGAEAATMMFNLRSRDQIKNGANKLFVDKNIFPQTLAVINTRMAPQGIEVVAGDYKIIDLKDGFFGGAVIQYPDSNGNVVDYKGFTEKAHAVDCKVAVATDLMALTLLVPPGEWGGADIAFGSSQRFGIPMFYGGPSAGFFATKKITNVIFRDVSSDFLKMPMVNRLIAWLCKPANNISNARKRRPIYVRLRLCWLLCPVSMPYIMGQKD